jgi:hypothetical protein
MSALCQKADILLFLVFQLFLGVLADYLLAAWLMDHT